METSALPPTPQTTVAVLLGASEWPYFPDFQGSQAFANSARAFREYLCASDQFGLPQENLLDLFDTPKSADELDEEIGRFLTSRAAELRAIGTAARDVLLYFVGHGGFVGHNSDFYLAIRRTRMDSPRASGIQMMALADTITEKARHLRRMIILDCCFAAAAFRAFQAEPAQIAIVKTIDAFEVKEKREGFPSKGTTILCSSDQKTPSLLLPDDSATMFSKALLDALSRGKKSRHDHLSLRDVKDLASDILHDMPTRNAPRPVVHSPDQSEGDVADVPLFPNPAVDTSPLQVPASAGEPTKVSQQERIVYPLTSGRSSPYRQRMMTKVHAFWITGVLEQSIHGAALIALGLREQADAVVNPWRFAIQQPDRSIPPGTRIADVYDSAGGELLILGEPGSGKTTLLLELARDLLNRAERDDHLPMPVVFNLASWVVRRQPLTAWLVEELSTKYQVPRKLGKEWVDNDQILPLLDGLDEAAPAYRSACIDAINTFRQEHLVPAVVCSRKAEYFAQSKRVLLHIAVVVQPLTIQQIDEYLSSAGQGQLAVVLKALRNDSALLELATTPLMLNVLALAYRGKSIEDLLAAGSSTTQRQQIFATYVEHMLQRRGAKLYYTPQQTKHWLTLLAQQLVKHSQIEFYIERMQPDWLLESRDRFSANRLVVVYYLLVGLIIALLVGASSGLLGAVGFGLLGAVGFGLLGALIGGLANLVNTEIKPAEVITWSWMGIWRRLGRIELLGNALGIGLIFGLVGGQVGTALAIKPVSGLIIGKLIFGLVGMLIFVLVGGLSSTMLDKHSLIKPNQGIHSSARNSLLVGLASGIVFGLVFGLLSTQVNVEGLGLTNGLSTGLEVGLIFGLLGGLIIGLRTGGAACIQHFVLRSLLWLAQSIPLNYPQFLDYAAERLLLRKVGGGYIFYHRLLLDYFTMLDNLTTLD